MDVLFLLLLHTLGQHIGLKFLVADLVLNEGLQLIMLLLTVRINNRTIKIGTS